MEDAKIHSKRGVWYVTEPGCPVKTFESEAAAIAYIACTEPDDMDSILDEDWDDDEE